MSDAVFGIGDMVSSPGASKSGGLLGMGVGEQDQARQGLAQAAAMETRRNAANKIATAQRQQGNEQLAGTVGGLAGGAVAGAEFGSAAGPWGTLIGGLVGAVAGRFF